MRITKKKVLAAFMTVALVGSVPAVAMADDAIKSQGNFNFKNGEAVFYSSDLHYLNSKVEEQITAVTEGKNSIANAIESKGAEVTSESTVPTFLELVSGINSIGTLGTAGVGDVLAGETFYNGTEYSKGVMINHAGEMIEVDSVSISNKQGVISITDPGYYDTDSKLVFNAEDVFNSVIKFSGNVKPNQVLAGKTYHSTSPVVETGTMPDYAGKAQNANISVNGTTGTVSIPSEGYYDTSSALNVNLTNYAQKIQDEAFIKVGTVEFITTQHDVYETIDCTGINGWQNLTSSNFLAVPTMVKVFFNNRSGNVYDFGGTLGNINDPARGLFAYDAGTGQLKVYGNGSDMTPNNEDTIMLWYQSIDVYVMR